MEYPNRITVAMTDDMFKTIKANLGIRHIMEGLNPHCECDVLLLHMVKAIEDNETNPIYLRSLSEAKKEMEAENNNPKPKG